MLPKEFIQDVLIDEIGQIHRQHPYISFSLMAIGIEFLGKCLNKYGVWDKQIKGKELPDFNRAIIELKSFYPYKKYLHSHKLRDSLRNGFLHSFVPKDKISLSSKDEMSHLVVHNGVLNLKCEDFYNHFRLACEEVIRKTDFRSNKIDSPFIHTPGVCESLTFSGSTLSIVS